MRLLVSVLLAFAVTGAGPIPRQEAADTASSSKIWVGRHAEFEGFLENALIVRFVDLSEGVTRPRRAFFDAGGPAASAIMKTIRPVREGSVLDSYKSEIAAYETRQAARTRHGAANRRAPRRLGAGVGPAVGGGVRETQGQAGQTSPDIALEPADLPAARLRQPDRQYRRNSEQHPHRSALERDPDRSLEGLRRTEREGAVRAHADRPGDVCAPEGARRGDAWPSGCGHGWSSTSGSS